MTGNDPITIWAPDTIVQTTFERLKELIRVGGIDYKRLHDPEWRNNPYKDGIIVDLDEDDVATHIAAYIVQHSNPGVTPDGGSA